MFSNQLSEGDIMKNIVLEATDAYKTSDGLLFECETRAAEHQQGIIGALLDTLLPHDDRGNVTMVDRHNLLMKMLEDDKLPGIIRQLNKALERP